MKIYIPNEEHLYILFLDIENDKDKLKQLGGILFKKINNLYELQGSINLYIKDKKEPSKFFTKFTGITNSFLQENGMYEFEAANVFKEFLEPTINLLIVGHGLKTDKDLLKQNHFDIEQYEHYCTWEHSKKLLPNNEKYNVQYLSQQQGWFLSSPHDAYHDAWALVPIYTFLKEMEK